MITFIVPKNSGLKKFTKIALEYVNSLESEIIECRGEDIPAWVEDLIKKGKSVIGLTGEDLFREYTSKNWKTNIKIKKIIPWNDSLAIYGKPALCLIGPKEKTLEQFKGKATVTIPTKYKFLSKKYLNQLESQGYRFVKKYLNGNIEATCSLGISDLAIDIVYTGNSLKKNNLRIYDKIIESNFVIIGEKNDRKRRK